MPKLNLIDTLESHKDRVWNVAWDPSGSLLASCGADKTIRIWGKQDEKWICKAILVDGHQRTIRSVAWSPCGNLIASTSFDATTCIWDRRGGEFECIATLEGHENEVKSASWAPSGNLLATCSRDKSVWIWEVDEEMEFECAAVLTSHSQDVKQILWHPHEEILASASYDNTIKFYQEDGDDWTCTSTLDSHQSTVWGLTFEASGERFASCSDDCTVKIWKNYKSGNSEAVPVANEYGVWKCLSTLSGYHTRTIYDISWCPLTGLIATASGDNAIRIFEEDPSLNESGHTTFNLVVNDTRAHTQDVNSISWNPKKSGIVASCSDDGTIKLWSYES